LSNSEKFDNAILTLSTGALAISLAFIKDIVPLEIAQNLWLLKASWWLFGFSIISTLVSFAASQLGISRQLKYAEEYYLNKSFFDTLPEMRRVSRSKADIAWLIYDLELI
jgi:hypothetical protein